MRIRSYRPEDREGLLALWKATGLLVRGSVYELDLDRKLASPATTPASYRSAP